MQVILPIPVVILGSTSWQLKIVAVVVPYCINLLVSNFVEPTVFGKRLRVIRHRKNGFCSSGVSF